MMKKGTYQITLDHLEALRAYHFSGMLIFQFMHLVLGVLWLLTMLVFGVFEVCLATAWPNFFMSVVSSFFYIFMTFMFLAGYAASSVKTQHISKTLLSLSGEETKIATAAFMRSLEKVTKNEGKKNEK